MEVVDGVHADEVRGVGCACREMPEHIPSASDALTTPDHTTFHLHSSV